MKLTKQQINEMEKLSEPLVKFLCNNCHPHVQIVVEPDGVSIFEGIAGIPITKFLED